MRVLALAGVLAIAAAACSSGKGPSPSNSSSGAAVKAGGTYRTAVEDFGFTNAFDPTGEYLGSAFGMYDSMLLRALLGYKYTLGLAGDQVVPDLASAMPTVSSDGLTYSFDLRSGIKFGPPVNRDVTSKDVLYAFQRIESKAEIAQYGF